jgi:hypothetical protein
MSLYASFRYIPWEGKISFLLMTDQRPDHLRSGFSVEECKTTIYSFFWSSDYRAYNESRGEEIGKSVGPEKP